MPLAEGEKPDAQSDDAHERGRGRHANEPHEVPAKGWLDILSRTGKRISADNTTIVAAGVAFYAFVAVVPALAATIGIYGLVSDPTAVSNQITSFAKVLPHEVLPMIEEQLKRITTNVGAASMSTIIGLLIALYSSASATKALIQGMNICYGEREKRSFIKLNLIAIVMTVGAIVAVLLAFSLVAIIPAILQNISFGLHVDNVINYARWPILLVGFITGLSFVYRYGPSRQDAKWSWVTWGAAVAALLWVGASGLFSLYVAKFGSYDKTYGSLGAIVVFLMWLWLSALSVLVGAELNAEMERQTLKDTTDGPPVPLGQRGAVAADTVGPSRHRAPKKGPPEKARRGDKE